MSVEAGLPENIVRVNPPGATFYAVAAETGWLVVADNLENQWDRFTVTDGLKKPWRPARQLVESRYEKGTYVETFVFDGEGGMVGLPTEYARSVRDYSFEENSVIINVANKTNAKRVLREAAARLRGRQPTPSVSDLKHREILGLMQATFKANEAGRQLELEVAATSESVAEPASPEPKPALTRR